MTIDLKCPYCGVGHCVSHDSGETHTEGTAHEVSCKSCEKNFVFYTRISFSYSAFKADCLNGADHALKMSKTYPVRFSKMRCQQCEFEQEPTDAEFAAAGINLEVTYG